MFESSRSAFSFFCLNENFVNFLANDSTQYLCNQLVQLVVTQCGVLVLICSLFGFRFLDDLNKLVYQGSENLECDLMATSTASNQSPSLHTQQRECQQLQILSI